MSALVRLGARVVVDAGDVPLASQPIDDRPTYLPVPRGLDAGAATTRPPTEGEPEASVDVLGQGRAEPGDHELSIEVAVRNRLVPTLATSPEVGWALKEDLARALAVSADRAFLEGNAPNPIGIANRPGVEAVEDAQLDLAGLREVVRKLRHDDTARFASAGWIVAPKTLDEITRIDAHGRSLDSTRLLRLDGADGGKLLGYRLVASPAAGDRAYFSSDWSQAWIATSGRLVTVDVSADARFERNETLVRAVMLHDLVVMRPSLFTYLG